jgi:hypothetical protein
VKYKGGKCEVCGYKAYHGAMDFHHLNPNEKDFKISSKLKKFDDIKTELDKCALLCACCHKEVHANLRKL